MIPSMFVTVHTHWVIIMYYNFFEYNENAEKYHKSILPTPTWEIQIRLHLLPMEREIKRECQKLIRSILKWEEDVQIKGDGIKFKENVV